MLTSALSVCSRSTCSEGIGKNVVLSNFRDEIVEEFVQSDTKYRIQPIPDDISPSRRIVAEVESFA
jgi:hypothetical protein